MVDSNLKSLAADLLLDLPQASDAQKDKLKWILENRLKLEELLKGINDE